MQAPPQQPQYQQYPQQQQPQSTTIINNYEQPGGPRYVQGGFAPQPVYVGGGYYGGGYGGGYGDGGSSMLGTAAAVAGGVILGEFVAEEIFDW